LVPEPERYRFQQLRNVEDYLALTLERRREISAEQQNPELLSLTRDRLSRLIHAMEVERALVEDVLAPITCGLDAQVARSVPSSALPARNISVLEMYETTFRDWAWGDAESERALSLVARLARAATAGSSSGPREAALGTLAVFGAGACRLAVDVHRSLGPVATFALDMNPLPLLIAHRVLRGEVVDLYEYPVGARGTDNMAVLQRLQCRVAVPAGLTLVLADGRQPPFGPGSLDTVLTPWYIDVVAADVSETAATMHRLLRQGGIWLNQGPLRFTGAASGLYCIEEVRELVVASGFEIIAEITEDQPYFDSPFAGSRRVETVYSFAAKKVGPAPRVPRAGAGAARAEPSWMLDATKPIPVLPGLEELQERFVVSAGAISLIDGTRSIVDLAEALGHELGIEPQKMIEPVRTLLVTLLLGK